MEQLLPMSLKQLNKLDILRRAERREITQREAADMLGVRERTVRRKLNRLKKDGPSSLHHGLRDKQSNNALPFKEVQKIEALLRNKYSDFGPTLATEKLEELHGIKRDPKTIRQIQVRLHLFKPRRTKKNIVHRTWRLRRAIFGELVQFDGSYHNWFEGRGGIEKACLLLAVDDATGDILYAKFDAHEGVLPVMGFWLEYVRLHGIPQAIYLDRFSTYSMNMVLAAENPDTLTQFERVCREIGTKAIHAYSSQAKGRVENKFKTLQDRLVKEMRLQRVSSIKEANVFLGEIFVPQLNERFSKLARAKGDLHRKPSKTELNEILPYLFCRLSSRVLQNDFTISYNTQWFQLLPTKRLAMRPKEHIAVHELPDESIRLLLRGKEANFQLIPKPIRRTKQQKTVSKTLIYS